MWKFIHDWGGSDKKRIRDLALLNNMQLHSKHQWNKVTKLMWLLLDTWEVRAMRCIQIFGYTLWSVTLNKYQEPSAIYYFFLSVTKLGIGSFSFACGPKKILQNYYCKWTIHTLVNKRLLSKTMKQGQKSIFF